jgi:uncharacterized protein
MLAILWLLLAVAAFGQIEGTWQGTLAAGPMKLRMGLHIERNSQGAFVSKIDSLDQGALGIPVAQTSFAENKLHLEMPNMRASYDGTLNADGRQITGRFTQGASIPLIFSKVEKIEEPKRPQTPQPPFPYKSEDVIYENKAGGVTLAATLTVPQGPGPFPAAILITGSGPQDRDETLLGHKPFWVIADHLSRHGIAVLRVDDRGTGKSTGNSTQATLDDMAGDVLTGIGYLKSRKEVDAKHIGVIGHSEGGILGPLVASRSSDVAFVVMLAGTGVPGADVLYLQAAAIARNAGQREDLIAANRAVQEMFFGVLKAEAGEKDQKVILEKLRTAWATRKSDPKIQQLGLTDQDMNAQFTAFSTPEMRTFILHDPAPVLRSVKVPVLALNGSRDLQVPPSQNLAAIVAALTAGGNPDVTAVELPGLNHLFQHCQSCSPAEYGTLEETFSPGALEMMSEWISRHTH